MVYKGFNKGAKRRYYSPETKKRAMDAFKKNRSNGLKKKAKERREARQKTREVYAMQGRSEELEELSAALVASGTKTNTIVYDKDGNMIPLAKSPAIHPNSKYNKLIARQICNLISEGSTVSDVCNKHKVIGYEAFRKWYRDLPEFRRQVDQAYTERADYYVDKLFELMEEVKGKEVGVKEAAFVADNIKWIAERLHPKFMQKRASEGISVQVNDDAKVQFQIMLADAPKTEILTASETVKIPETPSEEK